MSLPWLLDCHSKSAAHRDKSREWNVSKQKKNPVNSSKSGYLRGLVVLMLGMPLLARAGSPVLHEAEHPCGCDPQVILSKYLTSDRLTQHIDRPSIQTLGIVLFYSTL